MFAAIGEVLAKDGQQVQVGDPILVLSDPDLLAEREGARAAIQALDIQYTREIGINDPEIRIGDVSSDAGVEEIPEAGVEHNFRWRARINATQDGGPGILSSGGDLLFVEQVAKFRLPGSESLVPLPKPLPPSPLSGPRLPLPGCGGLRSCAASWWLPPFRRCLPCTGGTTTPQSGSARARCAVLPR